MGVTSGKVSAVIAAAGNSSRMGFDKLFAELEGIPVICRTLAAFERCEMVDEIVLVVSSDRLEQFTRLAGQGFSKLCAVLPGGKCRQESVYAGTCACSDDTALLCIHDGARPLVTQEVIREVLQAAEQFGAATAAVALKDTVKRGENGFVADTPEREKLWAVQTPQAFDAALYRKAYAAARQEYSDDCQLIEAIGGRVALCRGDYRNIKLTTPEDMLMAGALLRKGDA